jgi:hypothetical protein
MSRASRKRRTRKIRRNNRKVIKHGRSAAPSHKLKGGRTGQVHAKKMKAKFHGVNDRADGQVSGDL